MKIYRFILFTLFTNCFLLNSALYAQDNKLTGLPLIKNYLPSEHGGTPQNWAIVQDKRGVMYFANTGGLLEYDGVSWRLVEIENDVARTVAIDDEGTIFIGGIDQFGFLTVDNNGKHRYQSLTHLLPVEERNFGDIWTIWPTDGAVYFQSPSHIFAFNDPVKSFEDGKYDNYKIWKSKSVFSPAFIVEDNYFVPESGTGILTILADSLKLCRGGEFFKQLTVYSMLPYFNDNTSESEILIGTESGFYIYNGSSTIKFKTEADNYIIKNQLYLRGAVLSDNSFAFGTQNGGLVIIDKDGKLLKIISKATGLNDNTVWFIYPGKSGELWLGLNNGIARLNYPSALSIIDSHFGLDGTVFSVNEQQGKFYVTTANGLYYTSINQFSGSRFGFLKIEGINSECWGILDLADHQLVAATSGVYKVSDTQAEQIKTSWRFAYSFHRSGIDKNLIYVGLHDGLATLRFLDGKWSDGGRIPGVSEIIFHIIEDKDGAVWLSTYNKGLIRITSHKNNLNSSYSITRFAKEQGISEKEKIPIKIGDKIVFGNIDGFISFDEAANKFRQEKIFGDYFSNGYRVVDVKKDVEGNVWIMGGRDRNFEIVRVNLNNIDNPAVESFPVLKTILENDFFFVPYRIHPDKKSSNILWITASDKLYRFDVEAHSRLLVDFRYDAVIREVKTDNDTIIYYGGFSKIQTDESTEWNLWSNLNSIEFSFSASSYINESSNRYQYFLEGFNEIWSEWAKETRKEYTNLPSGNFVFHIRALNALGQISETASFAFYIPTPWYKSSWALFIYVVIILIAIQGFVNYRLKFLEKKTVKLETIVSERTRLVREQKETLEEQAKKLVELDRLKSNFFTNISHEFRTPLTLVMGQIENILDSTSEEKVKAKLKMALSNSKRLLALINQLLELSRLEAGEIRLKVARNDLNKFLKKILSAFESFAERRNIQLEYLTDASKLELFFDQEKMEEIFNNLISNAIKFTADGGKIKLIVNALPEENEIEIKVIDNGIGISEQALPHIFDRFFQVDGTQTREYEGTGIGLAIVKELIDLHQGKIIVTSKLGEGTEFKIHLLKGLDHFNNKPFVEVVEVNDNSQELQPSIKVTIPNREVSDETKIEDDGITDRDVILVVEDNSEMRSYIKENLVNEFGVIEAKNGQEGLKKALEVVPDLIITDVMMPLMNGFDLTEKLKNDLNTSHIPIIMLTAKADEESKLRGLDLGVDDYLIKPFSKKELIARVGNLIKLRTLLKERYRGVSAISLDEIEAKPLDRKFLDKVFAIIKTHLEDQQFGVPVLAAEAGMSVSQLNRKLNALINQSAGKLIRSTKLDYAAQLLKNGEGNVSEIAYRVGFSDTPGFSHSFKEKFGCTPSEYVKSAL
jgi:signal transduction histidine kinase/DNA-binding response OmpR family regulator